MTRLSVPDCVKVDTNKLVSVLDGVNQDTYFNLNVSNVVMKILKNAIQGPFILRDILRFFRSNILDDFSIMLRMQ